MLDSIPDCTALIQDLDGTAGSRKKQNIMHPLLDEHGGQRKRKMWKVRCAVCDDWDIIHSCERRGLTCSTVIVICCSSSIQDMLIAIVEWHKTQPAIKTFIATKPRNNLHFDFLPMLNVLSIGLDRTTLKVAGNQHAFCWKSYRCCVQKGETERNDDSIAISGLRCQTTTKSSAMTEEKTCSKAQKDIKGGSSFYKAIIPDFDRRRKLEIRLFAQYNILQTMPYIRLRRSQVLRPLLCLSIALQNSRLC
ncbi:unnamed protein product [Albugo candida]|uniref:Uncharacterized protein n=1 Tax=Albugo candida TaxID=65357 RepID=A0A024G7E7_9STRA|nr:unnamed protein product [Albugo candida]|eukprot:CCI42796.1 unnamed protein product [Albugo candida]